MSFKGSFSQFGAKAKFGLKKHSPELCLIGGIIGFGITIVLACKATTRVEEVLDEYEAAKAKIEKAKAAAVDPELPEQERPVFTEEDEKKAKFDATKTMWLGMAKKYAPVALSAAISVGLFLTSYKIINGRLVGLMGAYTALDNGFKKYRKNVVDAVGEEKEREIRTGVKKQMGYVKEKDETGKDVVVEKEVLTGEQKTDHVFEDYMSVLFSRETSTEYVRGDQTYNRHKIRMAEKTINEDLFRNGFIFEKDLLERLGLPVTNESCLRGWVLDPANPPKDSYPIRLTIHEIFNETGDVMLHNGAEVKAMTGVAYLIEYEANVIWNLVELCSRRTPAYV